MRRSLLLSRAPDARRVDDQHLAGLSDLVVDGLRRALVDWVIHDRGATCRDGTSARGLLLSDAAVALVDSASLASGAMDEDLHALSWRLRAGLPVAVVLLGDVVMEEERRDALWGLHRARVFRAEDLDVRKADALAAEVAGKLESDVVFAGTAIGRSPSIVWVSEVSTALGAFPDDVLPSLGAELDLELADDDVDHWRATLAANLFLAELAPAYRFLDRAVRSADIASRGYPLWVDLDAGGIMLDATLLPKSRRVCGVQLSDLFLGSHVAQRATPSSDTVRLQWPTGEDGADELVEPYAEVLHEALCLPAGASPRFVEESLEEYGIPVFAILDCDRRIGRTVQRVVDELAARFPGVTFVLTTDAPTSEVWSLYEDLPIAVEAMDEGELNRVNRYVGMVGQLARRESALRTSGGAA